MAAVGYRTKYNLRRAIRTKNSLEVTFPFAVVEKEARARGLTVEEFIKQFVAVAEYDSFEGVHYTFEKRDKDNEQPK